MDIFTRLNRKNIQDRQIDTLIGISKGILADSKVNQAEAEFLLSWLIQNKQSSENPIIINLIERVMLMLEDGHLDADESSELFSVLQTITGEASEIGELAKTTTLPINKPLPQVIFQNMTFLFTGTCAFGTRKDCQKATESLGGIIAKSVTNSLDYLVLGTYVTDSWVHETFGRKIEKAMAFRDNGFPIFIITEEHWINEGHLA